MDVTVTLTGEEAIEYIRASATKTAGKEEVMKVKKPAKKKAPAKKKVEWKEVSASLRLYYAKLKEGGSNKADAQNSIEHLFEQELEIYDIEGANEKKYPEMLKLLKEKLDE